MKTIAELFEVKSMAAEVISAAKAHGKVARVFREAAAAACGDLQLQKQIADQLSLIRAAVLADRDAHIRYISARSASAADVAAFTKSVENTLTYAFKVAGDAAGCKFRFDRKVGIYTVEVLKAAGEPTQQPAAGKDQSGATGADIQSANAVGEARKEVNADETIRSALGGLIAQFGAEKVAEIYAAMAKEAAAAELAAQAKEAAAAAELEQQKAAFAAAAEKAGIKVKPTKADRTGAKEQAAAAKRALAESAPAA